MAPPKRLRITPLDDPPSDDDQPPSSKNQLPSSKKQPPSSKKPEDVVDEVDDSDEEEETDEEDEEEGSSSEEEEDSVQEATPPNAKVATLVSKPMKAQPQAQSTPVPARSGTKRKTTGGGSSENQMTKEDSKKMNQRVFREDDEIAILKGLADFISKTEKDPMKDPVAFHSFVKKSIRADATSEQLKRKVCNLKTKFKDGGSFTKEHDKKAFELSKKVWGNTEGNNGGNEGEENGKVNEKTPKSTKKEAPVRNNGSARKEVVAKNGAGKDEGGVDKSLAFSEMCKFGEAAGLSFNKDAMERAMGLLEESKAEEFEEVWRKAQIAELERKAQIAELERKAQIAELELFVTRGQLFVTRGQLVTNQARIALEAMKKSTN